LKITIKICLGGMPSLVQRARIAIVELYLA